MVRSEKWEFSHEYNWISLLVDFFVYFAKQDTERIHVLPTKKSITPVFTNLRSHQSNPSLAIVRNGSSESDSHEPVAWVPASYHRCVNPYTSPLIQTPSCSRIISAFQETSIFPVQYPEGRSIQSSYFTAQPTPSPSYPCSSSPFDSFPYRPSSRSSDLSHQSIHSRPWCSQPSFSVSPDSIPTAHHILSCQGDYSVDGGGWWRIWFRCRLLGRGCTNGMTVIVSINCRNSQGDDVGKEAECGRLRYIHV